MSYASNTSYVGMTCSHVRQHHRAMATHATAGSTGPATIPGTVVAGDAEIVARVCAVEVGLGREIILIDDGSTDQTIHYYDLSSDRKPVPYHASYNAELLKPLAPAMVAELRRWFP